MTSGQLDSDAIKIRAATSADAEALLTIYAPYVRETAITFELDVPSLEEFASRIARTLERYPYFVAERAGRIVGYAYAGPFKERAAYARSAEVSVYVEGAARRSGVGRALYGALEDELARRGIANLYACIAYQRGEDEFLDLGSVRFHERMGYRQVGHFHECACKFGHLYDMVWMEKIVG